MHQQYIFCYQTSLAINNIVSQTTVATVDWETFIFKKNCIHGSCTKFKLTKCIRFENILYCNSQQVKFVRCQHMFLGYIYQHGIFKLHTPYCKDGLPDLRGNFSTEVRTFKSNCRTRSTIGGAANTSQPKVPSQKRNRVCTKSMGTFCVDLIST